MGEIGHANGAYSLNYSFITKLTFTDVQLSEQGDILL